MTSTTKPQTPLSYHRLTDGSRIEIFTKPDRQGKQSLMHYWDDDNGNLKAQAFNVVLTEWLVYYQRDITISVTEWECE